MNTRKPIPANQPWQVMGNSTAFYAPEGGTISFSVNGSNYSNYEETVDADTNCFINGCVPGMYIKINKDVIALY